MDLLMFEKEVNALTEAVLKVQQKFLNHRVETSIKLQKLEEVFKLAM